MLLTTLDTLMAVQDHLPLIVTVRWQSAAWVDFPRRRVPVCNPRAMTDPAACASFVASVSRLLPECHDTGIHDQVAKINAVVRMAAAAAFPVIPKPRQAHVSDRTWGLIQVRSKHRATVLGGPRSRERLFIRDCFAAWAGDLGRASFILGNFSQMSLDALVSLRFLDCTLAILRGWLAEDKAQHVAAAQASITAAAERNDSHHTMFAGLSQLKKFQARPHPGNALSDGTIAASPTAAILR